jgi:hypothetical protein
MKEPIVTSVRSWQNSQHPFLGYYIKHSLSSVFFAAEMQESGFGIQDSG